MSEQLTQLNRLQIDLHAINEELAQVAKPLSHVSELSLEERKQVADKIRAGLERWESIRDEISRVMSGPLAKV